MDITAVLALAVLVGMLVGLAAYVTVFQKQQPQQQQRAASDEHEEPVQVRLPASALACDCAILLCRLLHSVLHMLAGVTAAAATWAVDAVW
jgi:small neutral amino acid transporter SnatA (MarC family)